MLSVNRGKNRVLLRFDSLEDFEPWYIKLSPCMMTISEVVTLRAIGLLLRAWWI